MKRIKVLHIVAWWPHPAHPYEALFIHDQVRSTSSLSDAHVVFLTFHKNAKAIVPKTVCKSEKNEGITVHTVKVYAALRKFGFHDMVIRYAYRKIIKRLHKEIGFDIAHIHVRSHISNLALKSLENQHIPVVVSEHFSFYHTGILKLPPKQQAYQRRAISKWFGSDNIKRIFPVSEDLSRTLQSKFQVASSKVHVIPNVADSVFYYDPAIERDPHLILACAHWNYPKDPIIMFEALNLLSSKLKSQLRLEIIGDGSLSEEMKRYVQKHLSNIEIIFHGAQAKPFIAERLKRSNVLVHPTKAENLPVIIIESLSCGTPVVSMNVNGIPELVDSSNGILVEKGDSEALSKALSDVLQNQASFNPEAISSNARQKFTMEKIGELIIEQYKATLYED